MKNRHLLVVIAFLCCLAGCAERVIDITDEDGKVVGGCNAGYDWHFYGLQDSIDYMLYECAKDSIAKGFKISDERLLTLDFTLPEAPDGKAWNKALAMHHFHQGDITEQKLGYILAAIEYDYYLATRSANDDLLKGKITEQEYEAIVKEAKYKWLGS